MNKPNHTGIGRPCLVTDKRGKTKAGECITIVGHRAVVRLTARKTGNVYETAGILADAPAELRARHAFVITLVSSKANV